MDYQARLWLSRIYGARLAVTYREYKKAVDQARKRLNEAIEQSDQSDSNEKNSENEAQNQKLPNQITTNTGAPSTVFVVVRSISEYEALEQKDVVAVFSALDSAKAYAEKEKLERGEELDVFEMPVNTVPKKSKKVFSRKFLSHHHTSVKKRVVEEDEAPKSKKLKKIDLTSNSEQSEGDEEEEHSADLIDDVEPHEDEDEEDSEDRAFINDEEVEFDDEHDGLPSDEPVDSEEDDE